MFVLETPQKVTRRFIIKILLKNVILLKHLHEKLVVNRISDYCELSKQIGRILGPGFYAHDVLVDNRSGQLYLCETGFKFYDVAYCNQVRDVISDRAFRHNIFDQKTYAAYARSVFVAYCAEMGFL